MEKKKRIVIVGATSAIAQQCARIWISDAWVDLTLVGRNTDRIERVASDLSVRNPNADVRAMTAEFLDPRAIQKTAETIASQGTPDVVLIAHGWLPEQSMCQSSLETCCESLKVNGISPMLYAEAFASHMAKTGHGTLAVIGSVAGDRGRKSNYVYGSAKSLVTRYAQGLQHRFAATPIKIVLVKPGPTDTPMTAHMKEKGTPLAPVHVVARKIVDAINRGRPVVYVPGKWRLIMWVLRHMPSFVFNKLNI